EICVHLDGLPLAIELAAARIKLFPPTVLRARLQRRLGLLSRSTEDVPARHRGLRAALDWSYRLLGESERKLFRRLAVFVGGCTFEAIEAVGWASATSEWELVDAVAVLIDQSLLQAEAPAAEPRFRMLETLREFGLEKLREAGEEGDARERHRDWCTGLARQ